MLPRPPRAGPRRTGPRGAQGPGPGRGSQHGEARRRDSVDGRRRERLAPRAARPRVRLRAAPARRGLFSGRCCGAAAKDRNSEMSVTLGIRSQNHSTVTCIVHPAVVATCVAANTHMHFPHCAGEKMTASFRLSPCDRCWRAHQAFGPFCDSGVTVALPRIAIAIARSSSESCSSHIFCMSCAKRR